MKLLTWNAFSEKVKKTNYLRRRIENSPRKEFEDFCFFAPCFVLMRRGLARMVENVIWKFQKSNFASSRHQYFNFCEEYFGGEEFNVETSLSTVTIQKNSWIDQI